VAIAVALAVLAGTAVVVMNTTAGSRHSSARTAATGLAGASATGPADAHATGAAGTPASGAPLTAGEVRVVQTTADLSERLTPLADARFERGIPDGIPVIDVDDADVDQRVIGVGAAMTDTSAWLIWDGLPPHARLALLERLFGAGGIGLRVLRVPIGASDFTRGGTPYSYDDVARGTSDPQLRRFSIAHDTTYILPALIHARALAPALEVIASPWSPPAWMKTNDSLANLEGTGRLRADAYGRFARYVVRFVESYRARGVPIAAVTPQNEPGQRSRYPGLDLTEPDQVRLIRDLARALAAQRPATAIYGLDYAWRYAGEADRLVRAVPLAGVAWHCYEGDPRVMTTLHARDSALEQIVSECSSGIAPGAPAALLIAAFRNWASTVILWNLALDPDGGPVQPPNMGCRGCTGVVTIDPRTHTISYRPDYYELGQFGAFVAPGALRIGSTAFVTDNYVHLHGRPAYTTPGLDDVAFRNRDGTDVLLAYNSARQPARFAVRWRGAGFVHTLPAGATVTFLWRTGRSR
jgi:glucosylceramidase